MTRLAGSFSVLLMTALFAVDASAFWKGIGRLSGPGPFWGFDLILPIDFETVPDISPEMLSDYENVRTLNSLFFYSGDKRLPVMRTSIAALVNDEESVRILGRRLDNDALKIWTIGTRQDPELIEDFEREFLRSRAPGTPRRTPVPIETAQSTPTMLTPVQAELDKLYREWAVQVSTQVRRRTRFFGVSYGGLFNSQRTVRLSKDNRDEKFHLGRQLLTIGLSYQQSLENELPYPESYAGSRTVRWLTLYPAYEWRFGLSPGQTANWFVNGGPALHFFWGDAFETRNEFSARVRGGFRYEGISVGVEGDVFLPSIPHTAFGSTDTNEHRFGWAFFVGYEFPRLLH